MFRHAPPEIGHGSSKNSSRNPGTCSKHGRVVILDVGLSTKAMTAPSCSCQAIDQVTWLVDSVFQAAFVMRIRSREDSQTPWRGYKRGLTMRRWLCWREAFVQPVWEWPPGCKSYDQVRYSHLWTLAVYAIPRAPTRIPLQSTRGHNLFLHLWSRG